MTRLNLLLLIASVLSLVTVGNRADAEMRVPDGWVKGGRVQANTAETAAAPACCALGKGHPCCVAQKRFNASRPHQVGQIEVVDLEQVSETSINTCSRAKTGDMLPPAEHAAVDFGLRVHGEGVGADLLRLKGSQHVRMVPYGLAGAIDARNAGFWFAGARSAFIPDSTRFNDIGVAYGYHAPWKRVDRLAFHSVSKADASSSGKRSFRFFDGSFDIVTGRVGAGCHYQAPLISLLDEWVYGFIAEQNGKRALHVVMPMGDNVHGFGDGLAFRSAFEHYVLPLDRTSAVATRIDVVSAHRWQSVQGKLSDPMYAGILSVHVTFNPADGSSAAFCVKERSRR